MYLKRLELFGFKSFADRTVMDFARPLIGVVGPNGCGKSNVVDAVRWVLGEQRPTSMRGGEMIDVIFKGSVSRPAMSIAEATVVFDNSTGLFDDRGEEVALTRRVYRSGEGEYLIDGKRVRLKDVREILFGTGLGSRGYSVLEQGKIDSVLSANPLDRRAIFEEAAGISRYRQRKKETLSRLDRVQADLLRLDDVVGELAKRERSLKIQAGRAQRFVEAREQWRVQGLRLASHQAQGLDQAIVRRAASLRELESEERSLRARRSSAESDVQAREREQEALLAEVERRSSESAHLGGELRALDERRSQISARVVAWKASQADESRRLVEIGERLAERRRDLVELEREAAELGSALVEARGTLAEAQRELAQVTEAFSESRRHSEEKNALVLSLLHERTRSENQIHHLESQREALAARLTRARERLEGATAEAAAAREGESRCRQRLEMHVSELARLEARREELEEESHDWSERVSTLSEERSMLELESARKSSRIESLLDREREREGLERGARVLLESHDDDQGPVLAGELHGLLADHLRADTLHARALDAVLGALAQAIVVAGALPEPDSGRACDARVILDWLKEREIGRVQLLFRDVVPPEQDLLNGRRERLLAEPGVEGPLLDLIQCESGHETLARLLLDGVFVVCDLGRALELAGSYPGLRFVTPQGDLVDLTGVTGGHVVLAQGPVGRRSFAAELEIEREKLVERLAELDRELEESRVQERARRTSLAELVGAIAVKSEERAQVRGEAESARARLDDLDRAVDLAQHELDALTSEGSRIEAECAESASLLNRVSAQHDEQCAELEALDARRTQLEALREELVAAESRAGLEQTSLEGRHEALRRRCMDLDHGCKELGEELERTRRMRDRHAQDAAQGEAQAEEIAAQRVTLLERIGETEERLAQIRQLEQQGRAQIESLRKGSEELTTGLEDLLARLSDTRLEEQKLELALEELMRRVQEDFGRQAHETLRAQAPEPELAEEAALAELEREVQELRARLEKLGVVNLEAVEELEEVSTRLGFLRTQRDDLENARRTLDGTLHKLNTEAERLFLETFAEVRQNFRGLFRQLFGGGKADVELVEGQDVLEAGIEITARPPGRESLPISLLSGGQRTLTALAILFAIFRARPSPFCVLDEVDAALDEPNIVRFLGMLMQSMEGTQFIVVTHNKATMSACDMLYGVTMAVRGVSKVVSVELEEVDEFVPEAVGSQSGAAERIREIVPQPRREAGSNGGDGRDEAPASEERSGAMTPAAP